MYAFIHIFPHIYYGGEIKDLRTSSRFSIVSFSFILKQDNSTFKQLFIFLIFVAYSGFPMSEYSHKNATGFPPLKQNICGIIAQLRNWEDSGISASSHNGWPSQTWTWLEEAYSFLSFEKAISYTDIAFLCLQVKGRWHNISFY